MITEVSETRYQQKQHPGVLRAVHPDKPLDFSEEAYWLQRDLAVKAFVDQWLRISIEDGSSSEALRSGSQIPLSRGATVQFRAVIAGPRTVAA